MAYTLGAVKPWVKSAAEEIGPKFGISVIYGWAVGQFDHPKGLALDFMTFKDTAKGQQVANYAVANASRLSVTYVIWNRQIWDAKRGWHRYTGFNPHTDHVHVSFQKTQTGAGAVPGETGSLLPDEIPGFANPLDTIKAFSAAAKWLSNSHNWLRIFFVVAGLIMLISVAGQLIGTPVVKEVANAL